MTVLEWDKVGDRRYETGIDRGVLYLPDGGAVPWNGLSSVTEDRAREVKSYYIDGVKFLDHPVPGSFTGKIQAFTYPDELEALIGTASFAPGVFLHDQRSSLFDLSYRTKVGNDVDGVDHGYKIHLLYNILAVPSNSVSASIGASITPQVFEWALSGAPSTMWGIRPTSHISLDSRLIDPALLSDLEDVFYGTETEEPGLPPLVDLLQVVEEFTP